MQKEKSLVFSDFRCFLVIPLGLEPKTHSLEGCCSIQLSYGTPKVQTLKYDYV